MHLTVDFNVPNFSLIRRSILGKKKGNECMPRSNTVTIYTFLSPIESLGFLVDFTRPLLSRLWTTIQRKAHNIIYRKNSSKEHFFPQSVASVCAGGCCCCTRVFRNLPIYRILIVRPSAALKTPRTAFALLD